MKTNVLELKHLSAGYGERPVLEEINLAIQPGERVAVIGPNGCGKSTLLRAVIAEMVEATGQVTLKGKSLDKIPTHERVRKGLAYLRQTRNVFPGLSVTENLDLASWGNGADRQIILESFPALNGREKVRAGLLSGGERQALATAMVLMRNISVLLLDEPVAGLSPKNATMLLNGISALQKSKGFAMILVEHRLKLIRPHVDRVIILVRGKITEDTNDTDILEDPNRLGTHYQL